MKYDVFISYRRENGTHQANALRADIQRIRADYSIFMDTREMKGGDFARKLDRKIRESFNFVVVISKGCFPHQSPGKDYFLYEIGQAIRMGKNVIPVYYDGMEYKNIQEHLSWIEDFDKQNAITYHNDDPEGSVNQIISYLKTREEILKERLESLSGERETVRKELLLLDKSKVESACPVCSTRHSAAMSYCGTCGYKFFDELEKSVAGPDEQLQESERLEKHKEVWRRCLGGEDTAGLQQALTEAREQLQRSDSQRKELEEQLKAFWDAASAPSMGEKTLEFRLSDKVSFKMIRVEGGSFMMGSPDNDSDAYAHEKPQHEVTLSDYYIGETQVTPALWKAVMGKNLSRFWRDNNPVEEVSWTDCQEFIKRLNTETGRTFRLPTEAEWEYAARGGIKSQGYRYSGSDDIDEVAWYGDNSDQVTHSVKQKKANELGLYDMSGNVWEWCQDWFGGYGSGKETNPKGPSEGSYRVLRGGSWRSDVRRCRVACRNCADPDGRRRSGLGFRIALVQQ